MRPTANCIHPARCVVNLVNSVSGNPGFFRLMGLDRFGNLNNG